MCVVRATYLAEKVRILVFMFLDAATEYSWLATKSKIKSMFAVLSHCRSIMLGIDSAMLI